MSDDGVVLALARAIASGTAVDWSTAESNAEDESVRATIRELKVIAEIAELHRSLPPLLLDSPSAELLGARVGDLLAASRVATHVETPDQDLEAWGPLKLLEKVGEGAFGEVYRGWDPRLDREVALKLLRRREPQHDALGSAVIEEGGLLARVRHPNVVTVYGADRIDQRVGLWMELVRGRTLAQILHEHGPFGAQEAMLIGLDVCRALSAVHRAGLVHRDVKAQNVMREDGGRIVLMDFGAGLDWGDTHTEPPPNRAGTPLYIAPEVFEGATATPRADIYSLGVLLYHLVSGAYPVWGPSVTSVRDAHRLGRRTLLRDRRPDLPARFIQVVEQALSPDPAARYESAGAMELALAVALTLGDSGAAKLAGPAAASNPEAIEEPAPTRAEAPGTPWHLQRVALAVTGTAALLVLTALAVGQLRDRWLGRPTVASRSDAASRGALMGLVSRQVKADGEEIDTSSGAPSPDGRYISGVDWRTGDLAILEIETGLARRITHTLKGSDEYNASSSAPSPDGDRIAYAWANEGDVVDLRIINLDGSKPRVVSRDRAVDHIQIGNWSADGSRILVLFTRKDRVRQLALVSTVDGSVRVLRSFEGSSPQWINLSPDGRHIVYDLPVAGDASNHDIFLSPADTDLESVLVQDPANDLYPIWAPDGQRVFFISDRAGTAGLWMIPVRDGMASGPAEVVQRDLGRMYPLGLTSQGAFYYALQTGMVDVYTATLDLAGGKVVHPPAPARERFLGSNISADWSADGRYLAFVFEQSPVPGRGSRVLVLQDVTTGDAREYSPDFGFFIAPRWSPDGRSILVKGSDGKEVWGAHQIDARTGEVLGTALVGNFGPYEWLPVGEALVYARERNVLVHDLQTGRKREIYAAGPQSHIRALAVAPDGRWLAISTYNDDDTWSLVSMSVSDGEPREILRMKKPWFLGVEAWANDEVLFVRGELPPDLTRERELWAIRADGGQPRSLGLRMKGLREVRVHPDGRRVAFTSGAPSWEIRVMENFFPLAAVAR